MENTQVSDLEKKERLRHYMREYRKRMREENRCVSCGVQLDSGRSLCEKHLEAARMRNRRSHRVRTLRDAPFVGDLVALLEERRVLTARFNEQVDRLISEIADCDTRIAMAMESANTSLLEKREQAVREQ